jgi:cholesterol transport system auxiliary component
MIALGTLARAAAVAALALALAGCISLFPKQAPANLFRFGFAGPPERHASGGQSFGVFNSVMTFDRAAAADRILTVDGNEAAYIKGSRWVTNASSLFDEAVMRSFGSSAGPARLIGRGEVVRADYVLKLDVRTFEARYTNGAGSAPTVVVTLHAAMDRTSDRAVVGDKTFEATAQASDNRVGAIATAFDQAVTKVLGELVAWVDAKGEG